MSEQDAYSLENKLILQYWDTGQCFCNIDEGGRHYGVALGARNSQYGVSPKRRMSPEVYERWLKSRSTSMMGEKNAQYGVSPNKRMDEKTYNRWRDIQRKRKEGKSNPNAKSIIMYCEYKDFYKEFDTIVDCARYLMENKITKSEKLSCVQNNISTAIHKNTTFLGYKYKFQ